MDEMVEYVIAMLFGLVVIAAFAHRQLSEPIPDYIDSPVFQRLRTRVPSQIAAANTREAYIYFVLFLSLGYLVLCFSETLANFVLQQPTAGPQSLTFSQSPQWPLFVALAIVGLGPTVPLLREAEQFFRVLAYKSAGVPDNLERYFERIHGFTFDLSHSDNPHIKQTIAEAASDIQVTFERAGSNAAEATAVKDKIARFLILYHWTVSENSPIRWNAALARGYDGHDQLREAGGAAEAEIFALVEEVRRQSWYRDEASMATAVAQAMTDLPDGEGDVVAVAAPDASVLSDTMGEASSEVDPDFFAGRFRVLVSESIGQLGEDAECAFCQLFSNEFRTSEKSEDPEYLRLRSELLAIRAQSTRDIALSSVIAMSVVVFFMMPLVTFLLSRITPMTFEPARDFLVGFVYALGTLVLYASALGAAMLYLGVKGESPRWREFRDSSGFPTLQYSALFIFTFILPSVLQNFFWLLYSYDTAQEFMSNLTRYYQSGFRMVTGFALVGAVFATVFAAWVQRKKEHGRPDSVTGSLRSRVLQALLVGVVNACLAALIFLLLSPEAKPAVFALTDGSRVPALVTTLVATSAGLVVAAYQFSLVMDRSEVKT